MIKLKVKFCETNLAFSLTRIPYYQMFVERIGAVVIGTVKSRNIGQRKLTNRNIEKVGVILA